MSAGPPEGRRGSQNDRLPETLLPDLRLPSAAATRVALERRDRMPNQDRPQGPKGPAGWIVPSPPCFDRRVQDRLCAMLRDLYDALAPAPLPAHIAHLLDRLESRGDRETNR